MQRVLLIIDFKLIIYQTITSTKKKINAAWLELWLKLPRMMWLNLPQCLIFNKKLIWEKSIVSIFSYSHKNVHETTENMSHTVCRNHSILFWSYFSESNVAKNFFTQRKSQNLM